MDGRRSRVISGLAFLPDGEVLITWMDAVADVRNEGLIIASHQLHVRPGNNVYTEGIEDIVEAAHKLLADALEDFETTLPTIVSIPDDAAAVDDDADDDADDWFYEDHVGG